jgi:hypothetical protein
MAGSLLQQVRIRPSSGDAARATSLAHRLAIYDFVPPCSAITHIATTGAMARSSNGRDLTEYGF